MKRSLSGSVDQEFARWKLVRFLDYTVQNGERWIAICKCGTERAVYLSNLKRGVSKSCGCFNREKQRDLHLKHGQAIRGKQTSMYLRWSAMLARCNNENVKAYKNYGGRGITVCRRWRESFEAFFGDMGQPPSDAHTIDRRNNELGYYCGKCDECTAHSWPANVRWATRTEQMHNVRYNKLITFNGETKCLAEWAKITGKSYSAIHTRLESGMSPEEAFTKPVRQRYRKAKAA